MGYITKYGSFWGMLPQTSGRIFWVAPTASYTVEGTTYAASDGNDGLSPERALLTLAQAVTLVTANVGDVVVLLPGTHTMTAVATLSVAGVTYTGIPGGLPLVHSRMSGQGARGRTIVTSSAAVQTINITAADVEVAFMHFTNVSATRSISLSNLADRTYLHDLTFDMSGADSTSSICIGLSFTGTGTTTLLDDVVIRNCFFAVAGAAGGAIEAANTCNNLMIEFCTFRLTGNSTWANAILFGTGISTGVFVRDCDVLVTATGTTVTDFFDGNTNTVDGSNCVYRCNVPVGGGAFNLAATADGIVVDSYTAGTTGTNTVLAVT